MGAHRVSAWSWFWRGNSSFPPDTPPVLSFGVELLTQLRFYQKYRTIVKKKKSKCSATTLAGPATPQCVVKASNPSQAAEIYIANPYVKWFWRGISVMAWKSGLGVEFKFPPLDLAWEMFWVAPAVACPVRLLAPLSDLLHASPAPSHDCLFCMLLPSVSEYAKRRKT